MSNVVLLSYCDVRPPPKRTLSKQLTSKRRQQDELWRYSTEPIKLPLLKKLLDKEELAEEACVMFLDILVSFLADGHYYCYLKLRGVGFVKQVGFKLGVKERGSYGCAE